jgi:regulator of sigma E protease
MGDFFGSIWWLIVSLGVLVTFHEFGHYWVARRCGVRVLRFSVGFGRPLWKRIGRDGTEWVIAAIPLGGYVKFLDEREVDVAPADRDQAFNTKSVGQRIAIVAAGPLFNLLLALVLLWLMFMVGKPDFAPLIGQPTGIAAEAGLRTDDRILSINGQGIDTWTHAGMALTTAALDRRPVQLQVSDRGHAVREVTLDLSRLGQIDERNVVHDIGLVPRQRLIEPEVGSVTAGGPAAAAGIRDGYRLLALDGEPVEFWHDIPRILQARADPAGPVEVRVARGADRLQYTLRPERAEVNGEERWMLGIANRPTRAEYDATLRYGPIDAVGASARETWRLTETTLGMLYRMVTGVASLQNLSGPITIASYANTSAQLGVAWFLFFLAMLSIGLFIINMLPIPILDGGHLLYYLIELIKGSPVSERVLVAGQYVGLAMLAGLMGLAFYNDILRLVS